MPKYPDVHVQLSGTEGNVFVVIGKVARALEKQPDGYAIAKEFTAAAYDCDSYDAVLRLAMETVDVT